MDDPALIRAVLLSPDFAFQVSVSALDVTLKLFLVLLLVLANGFFVAAEFALVSLRRSRIQLLADGGSGAAKRVLALLDNLNAFLSAAQLGITLASLALGWIGEPGHRSTA